VVVHLDHVVVVDADLVGQDEEVIGQVDHVVALSAWSGRGARPKHFRDQGRIDPRKEREPRAKQSLRSRAKLSLRISTIRSRTGAKKRLADEHELGDAFEP
jgi:hypothetical protein